VSFSQNGNCIALMFADGDRMMAIAKKTIPDHREHSGSPRHHGARHRNNATTMSSWWHRTPSPYKEDEKEAAANFKMLQGSFST